MPKQKLVIVGGGLVGSLLAIYLVKNGHEVHLYEARSDLRLQGAGEGRSINLVTTHRGLSALNKVGLKEEILKITTPVFGRMIYQKNSEVNYQAYGKDESECNYSVSRAQLNRLLLDLAEKNGVKISFDYRLNTIDFNSNTLSFENGVEVQASHIFGADGSGSVVRKELTKYWDEKGVDYTNKSQQLGVEYKELFMPCNGKGSPLEKDALHIWPRGNHFLMALPNLDGSFTMTLYLPTTGQNTFKEYADAESMKEYFIREYPNAYELMPNLINDYFKNPTGSLATVRCSRWNEADKCLLIGDAAHGIVPFFGQGMNAGFEDCEVFGELLGEHGSDWKTIFSKFSELQKPNGDAIADMAIENFIEMSEKVGDQQFLFQKKVEKELESKLPEKYKSRYRLVVYTSLPYYHCQAIGEIQAAILVELCKNKSSLQEVDYDYALDLIQEKLDPYLAKNSIDFTKVEV